MLRTSILQKSLQSCRYLVNHKKPIVESTPSIKNSAIHQTPQIHLQNQVSSHRPTHLRLTIPRPSPLKSLWRTRHERYGNLSIQVLNDIFQVFWTMVVHWSPDSQIAHHYGPTLACLLNPDWRQPQKESRPPEHFNLGTHSRIPQSKQNQIPHTLIALCHLIIQYFVIRLLKNFINVSIAFVLYVLHLLTWLMAIRFLFDVKINELNIKMKMNFNLLCLKNVLQCYSWVK